MSAHTKIDAISKIQHMLGAVVQMKPDVLEDEIDYDPGMLGLIVQIDVDPKDDMHSFHIDTRPFDAHNDPLMVANYYDDKKQPTLTAKAAGQWQDVSLYYVAPHNLIETRMALLGTIATPNQHIYEKNRDIVLSMFADQTELHTYKSAPVPPAILENAQAFIPA